MPFVKRLAIVGQRRARHPAPEHDRSPSPFRLLRGSSSQAGNGFDQQLVVLLQLVRQDDIVGATGKGGPILFCHGVGGSGSCHSSEGGDGILGHVEAFLVAVEIA